MILLDKDYALGKAENQYYLGYIDECTKNAIIKFLNSLPSAQPERKKGEWSEKEVLHKSEAETVIEEWQSCKCSVCGRYDTRPYLYYFDKPHYCSWCGADMRTAKCGTKIDLCIMDEVEGLEKNEVIEDGE